MLKIVKVILTEKPSVAKNIADALNIRTKYEGYYENENYVITWAYGHLLQLYDVKDYNSKKASWKMENFPFIPERFQYKTKTDNRNKQKSDFRAQKQLNIIKKLMNRKDVKAIINACDYDREGQLIGDTIIYNITKNKRVERLLLNEWTPDEVLKGLANLKANEQLRPLLNAGVSRQWADWLIGINLTTVTTLKYQTGFGKVLNVGRVLMPTLKIIYDRDFEIKNFVSEKYFKLVAKFETENGEHYEGTYFQNKQDKFSEQQQLENLLSYINNEAGKIINKQVEMKNEYPPLLFNLSNLQGFITSKYNGWTSEKVLKVAQSLYEKKYITYPRTASVILDESLIEKSKKVLNNVKKGLAFENEITFSAHKRIFDSSKVESHSAIIPTYLLPKSLTVDETLIYEAIRNRFIMQFMPIAKYEETKLTTKLNKDSIPGIFFTKGKVQIVEGWKKVEKLTYKEVILPFVNENDVVTIIDKKITNHETKPPKAHTEKTLLKTMETCGKGRKEHENEEAVEAVLTGFSIGTPATRAETIKKLKDAGYIASKNKSLSCTQLGLDIVETFPVKQLFDLNFTGRLEKALADIEKRQLHKDSFLKFITNFTINSVERIKNDNDTIIREVSRFTAKREVIGRCPICAGNILNGTKGYGCSNWKKGCKFVIWKNDKFLASFKKKPTKKMVTDLLKNNHIIVNGLISKSGQKFNA